MKYSKKYSAVMWILGMIICPLGVALSAKSGFGVSMIEAPVYVTYLKLSEIYRNFSFGFAEYVMQGIVLILMCIIIKRFRWKYLLSFVTAFIFGVILDCWRLLVGANQCATMPLRIVCCIIGILVTSFAVACFFRTDLPQEVWELFVKEVSERYNLNITKVKWGYDLSSLLVGTALMLLFFKGFRWNAVGIGTLLTTLVNAPVIGFFGSVLDRFLNIQK